MGKTTRPPHTRGHVHGGALLVPVFDFSSVSATELAGEQAVPDIAFSLHPSARAILIRLTAVKLRADRQEYVYLTTVRVL